MDCCFAGCNSNSCQWISRKVARAWQTVASPETYPCLPFSEQLAEKCLRGANHGEVCWKQSTASKRLAKLMRRAAYHNGSQDRDNKPLTVGWWNCDKHSCFVCSIFCFPNRLHIKTSRINIELRNLNQLFPNRILWFDSRPFLNVLSRKLFQ